MVLRKHPKSPFWHYQFYVRGRRYRGSTKQTSKLDAERFERQIRHELEAGRNPFFRAPDLGEMRTLYLDWLGQHRSPDTRDRAKRALAAVFRLMPHVRTADHINPTTLDRYRRDRLAGGSSPFTVNLELRQLKAFLHRAIRQGWLNEMPCPIEMVRTPSAGRLVFLRDADVSPFLDALPPWAAVAARCMVLTGLRLDELRFLEWTDVDLDGEELHVRRKPTLGFTPKYGKERVVPLPSALVLELRARREDAGWVYRGVTGGQVGVRAFRRALEAASQQLGLPSAIGPHALRHTYGSRLAMAGVDLATIRDLMGHSKISTTAIYLHTDKSHRRECVERINIREPESKLIRLVE